MMSTAIAAAARPWQVSGITTEAGAITAARHLSESDSLWICDLSQIWGGTSWLYFAYVLDHGSGRCLSWSPHRVPHGELITDALHQATTARRARTDSEPGSATSLLGRRFAPARGDVPVVFGRGCRTAEIDFPQWAIPSAADAAMCDAFLAAMRQLVDDQEANEDRAWASMPEARRAVSAWIDQTYNPNAGRRPVAAEAIG
jgi:hypothetical protein